MRFRRFVVDWKREDNKTPLNQGKSIHFHTLLDGFGYARKLRADVSLGGEKNGGMAASLAERERKPSALLA